MQGDRAAQQVLLCMLRRYVMATSISSTSKQLPEELREAIDHGVLNREQLEELIAFEASLIDLDFDEAVRRAHDNTLPNDPIGSDLRLLISMLVP